LRDKIVQFTKNLVEIMVELTFKVGQKSNMVLFLVETETAVETDHQTYKTCTFLESTSNLLPEKRPCYFLDQPRILTLPQESHLTENKYTDKDKMKKKRTKLTKIRQMKIRQLIKQKKCLIKKIE
jgi:hypothetical protein